MKDNKKIKGRFFTLIELLVVITIISILASMLLPALGKARSKAKSMACLSTMKSFGSASAMYANDFDGWHTYAWMLNSSGNHHSWADHVHFRTYFGLPEVDSWREYWPVEFICPNATLALNNKHEDNCHIRNSIGINNTDPNDGTYNGDWDSDNFVGFRMNQIKKTSSCISWCDSMAWFTAEFRSDPSVYYYVTGETAPSGSDNPVAYRHDRSANAAFFDGHAKSMKDKELSLNKEHWRIY